MADFSSLRIPDHVDPGAELNRCADLGLTSMRPMNPPVSRQSTIGTTPFGQNIHRRRFPEKQQHLRCRDLGYAKNSGISARMPRANTTEPSGHNGAPMKHTALPRHVKRSGRLAVIVVHESAEPFVSAP